MSSRAARGARDGRCSWSNSNRSPRTGDAGGLGRRPRQVVPRRPARPVVIALQQLVAAALSEAVHLAARLQALRCQAEASADLAPAAPRRPSQPACLEVVAGIDDKAVDPGAAPDAFRAHASAAADALPGFPGSAVEGAPPQGAVAAPGEAVERQPGGRRHAGRPVNDRPAKVDPCAPASAVIGDLGELLERGRDEAVDPAATYQAIWGRGNGPTQARPARPAITVGALVPEQGAA